MVVVVVVFLFPFSGWQLLMNYVHYRSMMCSCGGVLGFRIYKMQ
jgi:hypothetical protein